MYSHNVLKVVYWLISSCFMRKESYCLSLSVVGGQMAVVRLFVLLCALRLAKPLDGEISPIGEELRLIKRQSMLAGRRLESKDKRSVCLAMLRFLFTNYRSVGVCRVS